MIRAGSRRAFTYTEMMIIIGVTLLLAGLLMPNVVAAKRGRDVRTFKSRLRSITAKAKARAVQTGLTVNLEYDKSASTLIVAESSPDGGERPLDKLALPDGVSSVKFSADKYESDNGEWRVPIFADGSSAGGGIEFEASGETFSYTVSRDNARATVAGAPLPDLGSDRWTAGGYERRS